jgi:pyruvate dehydrogenase E1 component
MVVATPSGITLAPEGGAHQSLNTPMIGMAQDGLTYFEPAYVDELSTIMAWTFRHMQAADGGSAYLRLSTRPLAQPQRTMTEALATQVVDGAYWLREPAPGAELAIAYAGALAPEAIAAHEQILEDIPGAGLLAVTSPDRLHAAWRAANTVRQAERTPSHIERLLSRLSPDAGLVTIIDGHPATLSWLGAVGRHRIRALGVERFGQSGDIQDLYRLYGLDTDAIVGAAASVCLG